MTVGDLSCATGLADVEQAALSWRSRACVVPGSSSRPVALQGLTARRAAYGSPLGVTAHRHLAGLESALRRDFAHVRGDGPGEDLPGPGKYALVASVCHAIDRCGAWQARRRAGLVARPGLRLTGGAVSYWSSASPRPCVSVAMARPLVGGVPRSAAVLVGAEVGGAHPV